MSAVDEIVGADLLIEAVVEDVDVKKTIFRRADEIFAARRDPRLEHVVDPDHDARGGHQSARQGHRHALLQSRARAEAGRGDPRGADVRRDGCRDRVALAEDLGKTPAEANDFPGFVSNRILMPFVNEAAYALMEGVAEAEAIDTIARLGFAHPMGPLALADLIGFDTCVSIMEVLHDGLGDPKYAPCPLLRAVRRGRAARPEDPAGASTSTHDGSSASRPSSPRKTARTTTTSTQAFRLVLAQGPRRGRPRPERLRSSTDGTLSRATLIHELAASDEFVRVRELDDAVALGLGARARRERIRWLQAPAGTDERVVEIPWVLSRLRTQGRVLEVGYAFAETAYLGGLIRSGVELVGVDLAVRDVGFETVEADVRELPFEDGSFDQVLLVSTLEHVGADNTTYGLEYESDAKGLGWRRSRELARVLRRDGSLLVTVPLGEPGDYGWFRQEDEHGWTSLYARAGLLRRGARGLRAHARRLARGARLPSRRRPLRRARPGGVGGALRGPRTGRLRHLATPGGLRKAARRRAARSYRRARPRDL